MTELVLNFLTIVERMLDAFAGTGSTAEAWLFLTKYEILVEGEEDGCMQMSICR